MNYYNEIKNTLINNEINKKIKEYSKNKYELESYYNVGKLLFEAGKHYGDGIIKKYSEMLSTDLGKKYSYRSLNYMVRYYNVQKMQSVTANLSWGHWIELLSIKDSKKLSYYIKVCEDEVLTTKELRKRIKEKEFERLPTSSIIKLIESKGLNIEEKIKNPIVIKNNNYETMSEKILQRSILEDLSSFLKELGPGFTYIDNEYKIKIGDNYNYIDLLLFNYEYNCFVVVELKVTPLKKEHIGQIEIYMNYIDKNLKKITHNETIGLIICKKDNKYIIKYSSDKRISVREYELV